MCETWHSGTNNSKGSIDFFTFWKVDFDEVAFMFRKRIADDETLSKN
jgi:hypothetical protein